MSFPTNVGLRTVRAVMAVALFVLPLSHISAQQRDKQSQTSAPDDVVRVNTELVQTDVTVFDKRGRPVEGIAHDQFQLSSDGKPRSISFFEAVSLNGSVGARELESLSRDDAAPTLEKRIQRAGSVSDRGRVIFFFVDDLHLAQASLIRTRKAILAFIDHELRENDRAAIVSTSGQIGFLQQLTDNPAVLREAASRLNYRRNPETYAGKVTITEYDAAQVAEHFNRELFTYLLAATMAEFQTDAATAANMVRNRVHQISAQSRTVTMNTLGALMGLMRSSSQLPGRKIVFLVTDGFIADPRISNVSEMLREVTKAAAQVGAVVFPMDARGTFSDTTTDASQNGYPDYTGSVSRNLFAETEATQEPLQILAAETGGRAFINSNSFAENFARSLDESSNYYLLAWRPEGLDERNGKARLTVSIKGRPDLKVRIRRGFIEAPTITSSKHSKANVAGASRDPNDELRAALGALYPIRALPVALSVGYMNTPKGTLLLTSMQIDAAALKTDSLAESRRTEVDVLGAAIDDRGSISSFKQKLSIDRTSNPEVGKSVVWNQQMPLAPGLYQVRIAVREKSSGLMGSAMQWIEVPDLSSGGLALSSLFLGERKPSDVTDAKFATAPRAVPVDVDRRLARGSILRFQAYIYDSARGTLAPDVEIQTRVLRNGTAIIALPPAPLPTDTTSNQASLPYWAELALDKLPPGSYVLQVTAVDRRTKTTATQQASFIVE